MKKSKFLGTVLLAAFLVQSCGMYDLRSSDIKKNGVTELQTKKGKMLLEKAWKKQGLDKLRNFKTYTFQGKDTWKGLFGKMGKVWPNQKSEIALKYRIGTFDGQVTFLDGKAKGTTAGLQDWKYYETEAGKTHFSNKDLKENRRKVFGIAAYQYFTEMADRLKNAPIIAYAGEDEFRGQQYDLVFCTWSTPKPHIEHDQYVAWINRTTGYMDFAQYTIRDTYLKPPGYKAIGGAVEFRDFRNINGVMIPHDQIVYAIKLGKNPKKNLHRLLISDFEFDSFDETDLQVDKALPLGTKSKN